MTRAPQPHDRRLQSAFDSFHERNFMCPEPACEWGVIDTGDVDPITTLPITKPCPTCGGNGFLPRRIA